MKNKSIQMLLLVVTIFVSSCQKDLVINTEQFPIDKLSLAASDGLPCSNSLGGGGFIDFYQCKMLNNQQTFLGRMTLENSDNVDITRKDYEIAPY